MRQAQRGLVARRGVDVRRVVSRRGRRTLRVGRFVGRRDAIDIDRCGVVDDDDDDCSIDDYIDIDVGWRDDSVEHIVVVVVDGSNGRNKYCSEQCRSVDSQRAGQGSFFCRLASSNRHFDAIHLLQQATLQDELSSLRLGALLRALAFDQCIVTLLVACLPTLRGVDAAPPLVLARAMQRAVELAATTTTSTSTSTTTTTTTSDGQQQPTNDGGVPMLASTRCVARLVSIGISLVCIVVRRAKYFAAFALYTQCCANKATH